MDPSIGSNEESRLLIPLEGQSGAERDDPQAQSRADRLKDSRAAGKFVPKSPRVRVPNPVAQDQGGYIVGNKWVHLPVPFCEAPV